VNIFLQKHDRCQCGVNLSQFVSTADFAVGRVSYILFFFYVRQLYRQVLLRARISYGNSVCLSVGHDPVGIQGQMR